MAEWRNGRRSGLKRRFSWLSIAFGAKNSRNSNGGESGGGDSGGSGGTSGGTRDVCLLIAVVLIAGTIYCLADPGSCQQREVDGIQQHSRDLDARNRAHFDTLDGIDNTARNNAAIRGDGDGLAKIFAP